MAHINLREVDQQQREWWDRFVASSPQGLPFHRWGWLEAAAQQSGMRLLALVVSKGEEAIGVFPLFLQERFGVSMVLSPPPGCAVPYLGPAFAFASSKQSFIESAYHAFSEAFVAFTKERGIDFVRLKMGPALSDVRPFVWRGYTATPLYTYVLSLDGEERTLFAALQSETRRNIRRARKYPDLAVEDGGADGYKDVFFLTKARYQDQGVMWSPTEAYLEALWKELGNGVLRSKLVRHKGEVVNGIITAQHNGDVFHWMGAVSPRVNLTGISELLHWSVVQQAREEGQKQYDLMGANTPHLCRYKAKYNPELALYFELQWANARGRVVQAMLDFAPAKRLLRSFAR